MPGEGGGVVCIAGCELSLLSIPLICPGGFLYSSHLRLSDCDLQSSTKLYAPSGRHTLCVVDLLTLLSNCLYLVGKGLGSGHR